MIMKWARIIDQDGVKTVFEVVTVKTKLLKKQQQQK